MILHHTALNIPLTDFGITVPLKMDRATQVYKAITKENTRPVKQVEVDLTALGPEDLLLAHNSGYVASLFSEVCHFELVRCYELIDGSGHFNRFNPDMAIRPLREMVDRALIHASGTYQACQAAVENGFCFYLGGGMHHAMSFGGRGFCLINDIVIAIRKLQKGKKIENAWVIDVDAHKGDGTAEITHADPSIETLSIHMAEGWPLVGPRTDPAGNILPWYIPSHVDIGVRRGEEGRYLHLLREGLAMLASTGKQPDLTVVVLGADPYQGDVLPSSAGIQLSREQMLERDLLIHSFMRERKIPVAYVMAGGYGDQVWQIYAQFLEKLVESGELQTLS